MKEVAVAIITSNGKVLACQGKKTATYPLKWEFPGGKIEPGELAPDALARELHEELSIKAVPASVFHFQEWNYGDFAYRVTYFLVNHFTGTLTNHAFESFKWVTPSELLEMDILEGNREAIGKLTQAHLNGTGDAGDHAAGLRRHD